MPYKTFQLNDPTLLFNGNEENEFITRHEKCPVMIFPESAEASVMIAKLIAERIRDKAGRQETCVLGLATGSTPQRVYDELVRLHCDEGLSFANVITFNLDEYYPMHPDSLQSYHRFMHEYLFDHIEIPDGNINLPDGQVPKEKVHEYCRAYEQKIADCGGIDLQILGIGRTGHIGFNEPGSPSNSPTRVITLDHITRMDAASDFYGEENVPQQAITMGVGTILKSKQIILMAWGEGKAAVIRKAVEGPVTDSIPATFLQDHPDAKIILDHAASADLTRISTPWLVGTCRWNDQLIRKSVVWLCQKLDKAILKLTDRDYNDNGMADLLTEHGPSNKINIKVFNDLQHTITGWPGGQTQC